MNTEKDIINLAKWAEGNLSNEELLRFKKSEDYELYCKILKSSDGFVAPEFDAENVFRKIQKDIDSKKESKVRPLFNKLMYSAVASVAILAGIFWFYNQTTTYTTGFGEQLAVNLPDASKVMLNAKSSLSFHPKKWKNNRTLTLTGEAFFEVEKGSKFMVETIEGTISVLGTKFNIQQEKNYLEVKCFEGRVLVEGKNKKLVLTKGEVFKQINDTIVKTKDTIMPIKPTWIIGESTFKSIPLKYVLAALEKQYNISIKYSQINDDVLFTGSFAHSNLKLALKTVLLPMQLKYKLDSVKRIVIVN